MKRLITCLATILALCAAARSDIDDIRATVEYLASVDSRISGYPGSDRAADYVEEAFAAAGLDSITREGFPLTVPMDRGGELVIAETGERFHLDGLWPNHVRTTTVPAAGLTAQLIYGGDGRVAELNGHEVAGSAVLLEFNTGNRWLQAASLGARAILFIEPDASSWRQANTKFVSVPLDIPRFWLDARSGALLRGRLAEKGSLEVKLTSRMDWVSRTGWNVWGVVPGRHPELREQTIVVQAYYDGISVVPARAPSAETTGSIAALLELASHLGRNPPDRTIVLLATGAHFLAQRGIVDFLDRHARRREHYAERMEKPLHPDLFISLDLTSRGDQLGIWNNTDRYDIKRFFVPFGRSFTAYAEEVAPRLGREAHRALVNGISPIRGLDWSTYVPGGVTVDGQVAMAAGLVALSFVTIADARFVIDTPVDRPHLVNFENLARQSAFLNGILTRAFNDEELLTGQEATTSALKDVLRTLTVNVRAYPRRSQVPDRIVEGAIVAIGSAKRQSEFGLKPLKGVRAFHFHLADERGTAVIPGLPLGSVPVTAYVVDPETGDILYAPDRSKRAASVHGEKLAKDIRLDVEDMTLVIFPCASRPLFDLINPRELRSIGPIDILDHAGVEPKEYGLAHGTGVLEPVAVAFAAPDDSLMYLMSNGMILTNSRIAARGTGYVVGRDALERTAYLAVQDMWRLNDVRLATMREHAIENLRLTRLHEYGRKLIARAAIAAENREWDAFTASVRAATGITSRAYQDVMNTLNDTIKGLIFFLLLVLPAALFGERLVFAAADIRWQLAGIALIVAVLWAAISQVHPAFAIAHPAVIMLAFAIMAMATFVLAMIASRFNRYVQEYHARSAHIYQADINRLSASYAAFMLGISNMRRRKLRTGLTLATLTLLSFTVLSFTSFRQQLAFLAFPTAHEARYEGTLIRDRFWNELSLPTLDYALSHFDRHGVVSPRNWFVSEVKEEGGQSYIEIQGDAHTTLASGLLGLSPQETQVTRIDEALTAGRFFEREDEASCLLPGRMAAALGLGPEDVGVATVRVFGEDLVVRGLFDAEKFAAIRDLDDEPLTPADFHSFNLQTAGGREKVVMEEWQKPSESRSVVHVAPDNVLIMPYGMVWSAGGTLRSIGIRFAEDAPGRDLLEDFLMRLPTTLFAAIRDPDTGQVTVSSYTSLGLTSVEGLGALMIPMFIAALIVLNAMLGAVYERSREIDVYSAVGLAPMHIAILFLAEACVYAVIGVTLGYLLGQGLAKLLLGMSLVQGMDLNYSSISAIFSALMVMGVVLLSTLYPARIAAESAVPETVRRWVPPPPEGDRWEFDFPFAVGVGEVVGLSGFLANYFKAYSVDSVGDFYTEKVRIVSDTEDTEVAEEYAVQMLVWLAPFDMGVSQYMQLNFVPSSVETIYTVEVFIRRISGETTTWRRINRRFVNGLRKQFLLWHIFGDEAKTYHRQAAEAMLAQSSQAVEEG